MLNRSIKSFFSKRTFTSKASNSIGITVGDDTVEPICTSASSQEVLPSTDEVFSTSSSSSTSKTIKPTKITRFRPNENFKFPGTKIGERRRRCQHQWFDDFKWLHYNNDKDSLLCTYCVNHFDKLTSENNKELAFISDGFRN